jgi:hypothetical protein
MLGVFFHFFDIVAVPFLVSGLGVLTAAMHERFLIRRYIFWVRHQHRPGVVHSISSSSFTSKISSINLNFVRNLWVWSYF